MSTIYTLSVSSRIILDLHNLNNEGTEGNQQMTRTVWVVVRDADRKPTLRNVNAISGDMFKHIQAEHLHKIAITYYTKDASKFPLSKGAQGFDANRINSAEDKGDFWSKVGTNKTSAQELDAILRACSVTDLEGTLVTADSRSLPRKSCIEFGWVVGLPDFTRTDSLFHVKYDPKDRGEASGTETPGQAIFYRPLNSGVYAAVVHAELHRVGRNDITLKYVVDNEGRKLRAKSLLESLWYTFVKPSGAQRNTQHPHVVGVEGALAYSTNLCVPAPTASPLEDEFQNQLEGARDALNRLHPESVTVKRFKDQTEFGNLMADIIQKLDVPDSSGLSPVE